MSRIPKKHLSLALLVAALAAPLEASIFYNPGKWPADADGCTRIPVCIVEGSSSNQIPDGIAMLALRDPNPSLASVVKKVRQALKRSWERWGSVRFTGWDRCQKLSRAERRRTVGLYIHPEAPSHACIGTGARGGCINGRYDVAFKPWGNSFNRCIKYNWRRVRVEYQFYCVEQYAIHEFGHVLGFKHEWQHPRVPNSCAEGNPVSFDDEKYTIALDEYDWDSIMTYSDGCVDQTGVRFGSEGLSQGDIDGLERVYPRVRP